MLRTGFGDSGADPEFLCVCGGGGGGGGQAFDICK